MCKKVRVGAAPPGPGPGVKPEWGGCGGVQAPPAGGGGAIGGMEVAVSMGPPRQFFVKTSQEQKSQRQFFLNFEISICLFLRQILDKF